MPEHPPQTTNAQRWARLYQRGRDRGGVTHVADADAVGLPRRTFQRRVIGEAWPRPLDGRDVFALPGVPVDDRVRAAAALVVLGERSTLSHGTSAWLHGLFEHPPTTVHALVPADRRAGDGHPALAVMRSRTLLDRDVVELGGLRTTAVARTLRDVAGKVDDRRMHDLVTVAEQRRLVTLDQLAAEAERSGTAVGSARFRRTVRLRGRDRTDSGLERDAAALCRRHGFVPHSGPYPLRCPDRRTVHLDVAFPAVRFALECDGVAFHADARSVQVDRRRWRQIQAAGWRIVWVTRADLLHNPDEIIGHVRAAHRLAA